MEQISPYKQPILEVQDLGTHGVYLTNLNLILGHYKRISQDDKFDPLIKKVNEHLAKESLQSETKQIPSFPDGDKKRWFADQAFTLYTIKLNDLNNGTNLSEQPAKEWFEYVDQNCIDKKTGLPITDLKRIKENESIPRGSATAYAIKHVALLDPERAKKMWKQFKDNFELNLGLFAAIKEYPPGVDYEEDIDSGPVIAGISSSGTAFGIGSANSVGDRNSAKDYLRTLKTGIYLIGMLPNKEMKKLSKDVVSKAILFNGEYTPLIE